MLVPLLTIAVICPCGPHLAASAGRRHKQSFPDREVWRVLSTTEVGGVTQGQGVY